MATSKISSFTPAMLLRSTGSGRFPSRSVVKPAGRMILPVVSLAFGKSQRSSSEAYFSGTRKTMAPPVKISGRKRGSAGAEGCSAAGEADFRVTDQLGDLLGYL